MSEQRQHAEPLPQALSTDGQAVYSTTGEPREGDTEVGNRAGAVAGPPIGTPAVEPAGYAKLGTAPGEVKGSYMVGSKVGVADPTDTHMPAAHTGAAFGLAQGSNPAGGDAYAEPAARQAGHPDAASRGAPANPIQQERGAANAKGGN